MNLNMHIVNRLASLRAALLLLTSITFLSRVHAAPIPLEIKKVVAFIYYQPENSTNAAPNGTGFFVGLPSNVDTNRFFLYLVTARHVLRPSENVWLPKVYVRLNLRDGTSTNVPLSVVESGAGQNVFTHDDITVDIAVIPFTPDFSICDCKFLPVEAITSEVDFKNLDIHEGSDVFFTGMFVNHLGVKHNTPITRFGKVALITDEKIDWVTGKTDLYLMEANAYPGNSGAPVFFQVGNERANGSIVLGSPLIKLAGVLSGTYFDRQPIKTLSVSTNQFVTPNLGIAGVVPAYELKEILFSSKLQQSRLKAPKNTLD
jgi:hypothetical protein